mgnify:CR=1 FL=1
MGAATAVLLRGGAPRAAPLCLTAVKSFMGHAEPAAGIVGITRLALVLGQQAADPLLHLSAVNPYVASAGGWVGGAEGQVLCAVQCSAALEACSEPGGVHHSLIARRQLRASTPSP